MATDIFICVCSKIPGPLLGSVDAWHKFLELGLLVLALQNQIDLEDLKGRYC